MAHDPNPVYIFQAFTGDAGESEVDRLPPLEVARSPTRLQRVSSLSSPRRPLLVPTASSIGGLSVTPASPLLPVNFNFNGQLDMPGKPGRRKKLVWDQRFAKVPTLNDCLYIEDKRFFNASNFF